MPGKDLHFVVRNMMTTIMRKSLANEVNYSGAHNQIAFKKLRLHDFLVGKLNIIVCRKSYHSEQAMLRPVHVGRTADNVHQSLKSWFKNARDAKYASTSSTKEVR